MFNMNICNYGVAIGRLVRQPKVYENKDGSHKILYTLAVRRAFPGKKGRQDADFVNLETFLPADSPLEQSIYSRLQTGTMLAARYTLLSSSYTDAGGEKRYRVSLLTQSLDFMESRRETADREVRNDGRGDRREPPDDDMPF